MGWGNEGVRASFILREWRFARAWSPPSVQRNQPTIVNSESPADRSSGKTSQQSHFSTTIQGYFRAGMLQEGRAGANRPVPEQGGHLFFLMIKLPTRIIYEDNCQRLPDRTIKPVFLSCCWAVLTACFHFLPKCLPSMTRSTVLSQRSGWTASIFGCNCIVDKGP